MTMLLSLQLSERQKFWGVIVPLLFVYSLFRYSSVIFSGDMSLTNSGDGIGTISGIFALQDLVRSGEWQYIFSDMAFFENHGQALSSAGPFSQFWKIVSYLIGKIFSAETAYDVVGMLGYFFTMLAGFALFNYLGSSKIIAIILCVALASIDNNLTRATSHLFGLGVIFAPILVVLQTSKVGLNPNLRSLLILAGAHLLNLNVNEYYGYFGIFYTMTFFAVSTGLRYKLVNWKPLGYSIVISAFVFVFFACILYPNAITFPLLAKLGIVELEAVTVKTHVHDWGGFTFYSLAKIYHLFESDISYIRSFMDEQRFQSPLWEMSYRIGIVLPALIAIILYTIYLKSYVTFKVLIKSLIPWFSASGVLLCFALSPHYKLSLVHVTYELAPMLRVGVRALLYFDISMFAIFSICLAALRELNIKNETNKYRWNQYKIPLISILLSLFVYNDVSKLDLFEKMPALELPNKVTYSAIADNAEGILIEIPYLSPLDSTPESNYPYLLNRVYHHKILGNQVYYGSNNTKYTNALDRLSGKINHLDEIFLEELILSGAAYFAVSSSMPKVERVLRMSNKLENVSEDDAVVIFKVKNKFLSSNSDIREFLNKVMD
ncbi:hypothetical protein [Vibrio splendidus]|uniref:hypothetical protein n=1 Tax=Vibrio splendidus TaxID=29497 RepID=UPI000CB43113|nr:hypothetical protein [Vibrio splendidus]PMI50820.1 hypothetical protein BCU42_09070 [Vibrio splendidus]